MWHQRIKKIVQGLLHKSPEAKKKESRVCTSWKCRLWKKNTVPFQRIPCWCKRPLREERKTLMMIYLKSDHSSAPFGRVLFGFSPTFWGEIRWGQIHLMSSGIVEIVEESKVSSVSDDWLMSYDSINWGTATQLAQVQLAMKTEQQDFPPLWPAAYLWQHTERWGESIGWTRWLPW